MRLRALPLLGALVVLLGSVGSTAGAQTIIFTVKRYAAIQSFKAMTDEQAMAWIKTAEGVNPQVVSVTIPSINRIVKWIGANGMWSSINQKYPNENILAWKSFDAQHVSTLAGLGGGGDNTYSSLGKCYVTPGFNTTLVRSNGGPLINTSQGLEPLELFGKLGYSGGKTWAYQVGLLNETVQMPPGTTNYLSDFSSRYADITKGCYVGGGIYDFSQLPYGPVVQPLPYLGNALRGAAIAYYEGEQTPSYDGLVIEGYTDSDLLAECTAALCPGYTPGGGGTDPGTGGTGGTTTPACTKPDGSTSGNPYDCAPKDEDTKCSFIDIPCNLKYLFIPRKEFLSEKLKDGVGLTVKFPLTVTDKWTTNITFAGTTFPVGADFSTLEWNEEAKDQFRFYAWWATFLFLLSYLGVPFLNGKKGMADAAQDSTVGAAAREQAANDKAKADYDRLRADDSWKSP